MSLTCACADDYHWWYTASDDLAPLATKRARACCSCKDRIATGDDCLKLLRWRSPAPLSVAERIYGDEEPLADWYMCERCAGLYESLTELGYCVDLPADMRHLCREYAQMQRDAGMFTGKIEASRQV